MKDSMLLVATGLIFLGATCGIGGTCVAIDKGLYTLWESNDKGAEMSEVMDDLKSLEGTWKDAEEAAGLERHPDGRYAAKILDATIGRSQGGRLQIHWEMEGLSGAVKGKKVHKYDGLETEQNLSFVKRSLKTMGLDIPKKMKDLPKILEEAIGLEVEITLKTRDEAYPPNVYFNKLLSGASDTGRSKARPKGGRGGRF